MLQKVLKWMYKAETWAHGNASKGASTILDAIEWVLVQIKEALVG